jgi:hypothetical protein
MILINITEPDAAQFGSTDGSYRETLID